MSADRAEAKVASLQSLVPVANGIGVLGLVAVSLAVILGVSSDLSAGAIGAMIGGGLPMISIGIVGGIRLRGRISQLSAGPDPARRIG